MLRIRFLTLVTFLFVSLSAPLAATPVDEQTTTFITRFKKDQKLYLLLDKGMCFEVVNEEWRCENWLPGDPIKIERLSGYSAFNFAITNLSVNARIFAQFAYGAETGDVEGDLLKKRIENLEERLTSLEKLVRKSLAR